MSLNEKDGSTALVTEALEAFFKSSFQMQTFNVLKQNFNSIAVHLFNGNRFPYKSIVDCMMMKISFETWKNFPPLKVVSSDFNVHSNPVCRLFSAFHLECFQKNVLLLKRSYQLQFFSFGKKSDMREKNVSNMNFHSSAFTSCARKSRQSIRTK